MRNQEAYNYDREDTSSFTSGSSSSIGASQRLSRGRLQRGISGDSLGGHVPAYSPRTSEHSGTGSGVHGIQDLGIPELSPSTGQNHTTPSSTGGSGGSRGTAEFSAPPSQTHTSASTSSGEGNVRGRGTLRMSPPQLQTPHTSPGYVRPTLSGVIESQDSNSFSPSDYHDGAGVGLETPDEARYSQVISLHDEQYSRSPSAIGAHMGHPPLYAQPPGGINASAGHGLQPEDSHALSADDGRASRKSSIQDAMRGWTPPVPDSPCWAVLAYHILAFFALFFAPAYFDYDCDGDFDQADVDKFLQDYFGMWPPRAVRERKALRSLGMQRLRIIQARRGELEDFVPDSPTRRMVDDRAFVEDFVKVCTQLHQERKLSKLTNMLKEMLRGGHGMAMRLAQGLADPRMSKIFHFGEADSDGDIDISDILASPMPGLTRKGSLRSAKQTEQLNKKVRKADEIGWPIFTCFQGVLVAAVWLGEAIRGSQPMVDATAGLNTLFPGRFDMRLYRMEDTSCADVRWEAWRWIAYQYTHNGLSHILTNVVLTLILGIPLEGIHGTFRLWVMYNVGVLGGAFACMLTNVHSGVVGESGGVYALLGMHLADLIMNWSTNGAPKPFRWTTLTFLVCLAATDFLVWYAAGNESMSHSAHFGGYVAGCMIGIVCLKNAEERRWETYLRWFALFFGFALTVFSLLHGFQWPPRSLFEQVPWCWIRQVWSPEIFGDSEWHCIRCGEQACIDAWLAVPNNHPVSLTLCKDHVGWTYDTPQLPP